MLDVIKFKWDNFIHSFDDLRIPAYHARTILTLSKKHCYNPPVASHYLLCNRIWKIVGIFKPEFTAEFFSHSFLQLLKKRYMVTKNIDTVRRHAKTILKVFEWALKVVYYCQIMEHLNILKTAKSWLVCL